MGDENRVKVKHISKMDDETFLKHMNARHKGDAGIQHFGRSNVKGDNGERLLRSMHQIMHKYETQYENYPLHDHTHGDED